MNEAIRVFFEVTMMASNFMIFLERNANVVKYCNDFA